MYPSLEEGYDLTLQNADHWGPNGYTGEAEDIKAKPNGSYRWTGEFDLNR